MSFLFSLVVFGYKVLEGRVSHDEVLVYRNSTTMILIIGNVNPAKEHPKVCLIGGLGFFGALTFNSKPDHSPQVDTQNEPDVVYKSMED